MCGAAYVCLSGCRDGEDTGYCMVFSVENFDDGASYAEWLELLVPDYRLLSSEC
jgi:hypothetical protein